MDSIVERLREKDIYGYQGRQQTKEANALRNEAANLIQSLQADNAALRERIALLECQQLSTLSGFYAHQPVAVAKICDEVLDRSGALLGKVRDHCRETRALLERNKP